MLVPGLLRTQRQPNDLKARLACQLGAVEAIAAPLEGVPMGASHAIGHLIEPTGVGHGKTSCVLMPAVARWNARVNGAQQQKVLNILWSEPDIEAVLEHRGLQQGSCTLSDALFAVFRQLELPKSLAEVGVGRNKLEDFARRISIDRMAQTNAIPLNEVSQVIEILESVIE